MGDTRSSNLIIGIIILTSTGLSHCQARAAAAAASLQSCPTLWDPMDGSPLRLPRPWDSPSKYPCYMTVMNYLIYPNNNIMSSTPLLTPSKNRSFVKMYLSQRTCPI